MDAYDYIKQKWVHGAEAVAARRAQLEQELAIVTSERGAAYLSFIGSSLKINEVTQYIKGELNKLPCSPKSS